ncbi:S49 family peptidase (plasmid) [Xanthomonas citri pv. citri]|uniref:S49 family peptidase n=1 Tax=Xanthomonas citri TaxID=346 RepID=UPI00193229C2|nr:S49 family peptidase [Xanthomonas citri]QRD62650.1 S49 family peptidase [Xanthomonas citri pv. citri]QRD67185.1 S49 family peptidase [Xanthomonas citri pv. citri]QRD71770.1 S49 family peptidase [Xanthomonas citri pv. citri]
MSSEEHRNTEAEAQSGVAVLAPAVAEALESISLLAGYVTRNERRKGTWFVAKSTLGGLFLLSLIMVNFNNAIRLFGAGSDPARDSVALINITGSIGAGGKADAASVVPLIEKACQAERVTELVLVIDSPGGSPTDADRIVSALKVCREAKKPVSSVIGSLGASAAYMVAMHTDRVYASRYSLVGSIGAITRYVDASGLAERVGLTERVFKSGDMKGGPSNLSATSAEDAALMKELVDKVADDFYRQLQETRGTKLKGDRKLLLSGRIWTAPDAIELGLVDEIAVLEDLKLGRFKDKRIFKYRARPSFMSEVSMAAETFGRSLVAGAKQGAIE